MNISSQDLPLGFLVNTLGDMTREATIVALEGLDLSVMELGVLWLIDLEPDQTQATYARFQHRDSTTFGRIVDKLEAKQFVERKPFSGDRRAYRLVLTSQGKNILEVGKRGALKAENEVFSVLGRDVLHLRSMLAHVLGLEVKDLASTR